MSKTTVIAVVIFIALGVGAYLTLHQEPERGITRISFASVDKDAIDRVVVSGENAVELKKDGEIWRLADGKEAESSGVKRLLEAIPEIDTDELVTRSPERFADLEVDDEKGTHVKAFAGGAMVADFIIGKTASGGGSNVRVGDEVYVAKKAQKYVFSKKSSAWYNLKLFEDKLEEVQKVEVALAGKPAYSLVQADKEWSLEDTAVVPAGFRFDKNAARSLASTLVNARAREILDKDPGAEVTGLEAEHDVVAFVAKDGTRRELHLGKTIEDKEKQVYIKVSGKNDLFTVAEYTATNLRKQAADLRDLSMVKLEKDRVARLEIRDGKMQLSFSKQGAEWKIDKSSEKIPADFELDSALVTSRIGALESTRAKELAPAEVNLAKAGLTRPEATVTAILDDKSKVTLSFGKSFSEDKQDLYYARGNADDAVYVVTKWTRNNLAGGLDKFKKRPDANAMPDIDPKALSNLPPDVAKGLMEQMAQKKRQQEMMKMIQAQAEKKAKQEASN